MQPRRADDRLIGQFQTVSDGYFESMRAPLVMGRGFTTFDTYTSAPVVIVNETFLNRHRDSGRPVIGRRLMINAPTVGPRARNLMVAVSTANTNPPRGRLRDRRRRQGRPKRAARSARGTGRLFQREAVSLSRDVSDRARDGHRDRRTGDPRGIARRHAQARRWAWCRRGVSAWRRTRRSSVCS